MVYRYSSKGINIGQNLIGSSTILEVNFISIFSLHQSPIPNLIIIIHFQLDNVQIRQSFLYESHPY